MLHLWHQTGVVPLLPTYEKLRPRAVRAPPIVAPGDDARGAEQRHRVVGAAPLSHDQKYLLDAFGLEGDDGVRRDHLVHPDGGLLGDVDEAPDDPGGDTDCDGVGRQVRDHQRSGPDLRSIA